MKYFYGTYVVDERHEFFKVSEDDVNDFCLNNNIEEIYQYKTDCLGDLGVKYNNYVMQRKEIGFYQPSRKIYGHRKIVPPTEVRTYYFGAKRKSKESEAVKFFVITKEEYDRWDEQRDLIKEIRKTECHPSNSQGIMQRFAEEYKKEHPEYRSESISKHSTQSEKLKPGMVGIYQDDNGGHHAIIINTDKRRLNDGDARILFLTSKDTWNPRCRKATKEELSLLGRPNWGYENYFAPVVRPVEYFEPFGFDFPKHRVKELAAEFWGSDLTDNY